jgi:hypothetical protein
MQTIRKEGFFALYKGMHPLFGLLPMIMMLTCDPRDG